jgi:sorting nexin-4
MAVMEQDNFSNVSWSSEAQNLPGEGLPSQPLETPQIPSEEEAPDAHEKLDCIVGSPIKENDGTKDAFVSYLISTNV